MASLILKPGREKSLLKRHPWVFSGAVGAIDGDTLPGETVRIHSARGDFLAWAAYSPHSQIRARVWSWDEKDVIDEEFLLRRLSRSISKRQVDSSQAQGRYTDKQPCYHASDGSYRNCRRWWQTQVSIQESCSVSRNPEE